MTLTVPEAYVTAAERRLITELARGRSEGEAARACGISLPSLQAQLQVARRRMAAQSIAHLVRLCVQRALLTDDADVPAVPAPLVGLLSEDRLAEITRLRDRLGDSTDYVHAEAYAALDDLLAAVAAVGSGATGSSATSSLSPAGSLDECPLTEAQLETLALVANGYSVAEQERLASGIAAASQARRRRVARDRFGARNITHAVSIALVKGWITADRIDIPLEAR